MALIIPDEGQFQETLKTVLDLADRARDVRITTVQAIEVPDVVLERWIRFQTTEETSDEPPKRRPGRPRKNPLPEEQS